MAKQLNQQQVVNLAFTADASQAKTELKQLQNSLQNLVNFTALTSNSMNFTKDIQQATAAAAQLKVQLQAATNVNTGNLDLTKFQDQLNKSGMSLEKYQNALFQLGPVGEKAFADLSRSITLAEVPLKRTNALVSNLWVTLKNTVRWQLSSSVLHGFMGTVQSAYRYAQDLNESLNNIRIVTGQNVDQMAKFASEANKAAKALSTTTNAYTDAALIYYQQGLNDNQVKERTDITIKMANVSRQSAEEVSDQMTAIWNNFAKGSESLEHYADVMTRLGADTASSSDEIAQGLEKFSAIADMIGLSFDNAAAALATVTATTRQSADVVGTAFKTIFARIQGLSLGETLDDGTNLNKYSKALNAVGINIKEQNGELKDMDSILEEMGAKWKTLSKDQQVALAQTVAGVRQYNQLIALMDNFDFYQKNLFAAQTSEGSLQEQADIYAESWEAAQKRVKASAESVYNAILNDKFFIDLNNNFAKLLDGVKTFIDGMGGVQGVLLSLGAIVTRVFQKQIAESLSNVAFSLKMMTKSGQEAQLAQKQKVNDLLIEGARDLGTTSGGYKTEAYEALAKNQLNYIENSKRMTQEEQAINQMLMDRNRLLADDVIKKGEEVQQTEELIKRERGSLQVQAQLQAQRTGVANSKEIINKISNLNLIYEKLNKSAATFQNLSMSVNLGRNFQVGSVEATKLAKEVKETVIEFAKIKTVGKDIDTTHQAISKIAKEFGISKSKAKDLWDSLRNPNLTDLEKLNNILINLMANTDKEASKVRNSLIQALKECGFTAEQAEEQMNDYDKAIADWGPKSEQAADAVKKLTKVIAEHNAQMDQTKLKPIAFSQAITQAASALMAVGQIFNQVRGMIDTFNDTEATTGDKILALTTGIGMLIPAAMSIIPAFSKAKVAMTEFGISTNIAMWKITAVIMIITGLITAIMLIKDAVRKASPEEQLKKAQKEAQAFSDALNEAKQEAEDLKNVFDEYESIQEELDKCTKGTEEWTQALSKANNQVLELLSDYPELASMVNENGESAVTNEDGRLKIADWAINSLQEQANQKIVDTQGAYFAAQNVVREKQVQAQKSNIQEDMAKNQSASLQYDTSGYNASNLVSSLILKNQSDFEGKTREEISSNLEQLFNDNGIIASVASWTDVVLRTQDDFAALNTAIEANTAAAKVQNEALMTSYLQSNQSVQNSEYKDQIISASADQYDKAYKDSYEKWASTNVAGWFGVGTDEGQTLAEKYAEVSDLQGFKVENYRNDQTIDYTYQQEDGTTSEKINISVQAMAEIIAASEALAAVGDNAEALTAKFNQLYNSTDVADHALADFVAYSN